MRIDGTFECKKIAVVNFLLLWLYHGTFEMVIFGPFLLPFFSQSNHRIRFPKERHRFPAISATIPTAAGPWTSRTLPMPSTVRCLPCRESYHRPRHRIRHRWILRLRRRHRRTIPPRRCHRSVRLCRWIAAENTGNICSCWPVCWSRRVICCWDRKISGRIGPNGRRALWRELLFQPSFVSLFCSVSLSFLRLLNRNTEISSDIPTKFKHEMTSFCPILLQKSNALRH